MKRSIAICAVICAAGMMLAGCGANNAAKTDDGIIQAYDTEPQKPITPGDSDEKGSTRVAQMIYEGLVNYNADGSTRNAVAKSIEPNADSTSFTITIKDGWKFTDGTPVTAESFTKAWSYAANATNAMKNAWCFSSIKGYDELQKKGVSKDAQLSGLKVVDDHTFTVDMTAPNSTFPTQLGYIAFAPVPESAFKDMKKFGESPVGNGPYKLTGWDHGKSITLRPNDGYQGDRKARNKGIDFHIYTKNDAAYSDLQAGNIDVLDDIPTVALKSFQSNKAITSYNSAGAQFQGFTIPVALKHFGMDQEGRLRRAALSYAIDREQIASKIFFGTRTPATDFLAPTVSGHSEDIKGDEVLDHDAAKAKELWAQADAISKYDGKFELAYNADQGHKEWVDAVCNQLKNTLGIDAAGKPFPTTSEYFDTLDSATPTFAFYTNWIADWPSAGDFLVTLYASSSMNGVGSNTGNYSNAEFDTLLDKAAASTSEDDANAYYHSAEEILFKDLPTIPLWNVNTVGATGKDVHDVEFMFNKTPLYWKITKG
ncbi:peptide ABC transporter substrate-binding protein [Bifidobacterium saguinibicoloris]|uniref:peptide ABC transporter substrate-binding protein n=1 Tax=Bifidobacterium saguinibicoloris TaxID=2834433 RepID=UPI001C5A4E33|nr:ABC transporter substrate-binding protein [Bifidobacterium saguinibicoloris]MBW3080563.1 ABC transporter substrate-binding protein [Bifidobacterium saguinibicoloris]